MNSQFGFRSDLYFRTFALHFLSPKKDTFARRGLVIEKDLAKKNQMINPLKKNAATQKNEAYIRKPQTNRDTRFTVVHDLREVVHW